MRLEPTGQLLVTGSMLNPEVKGWLIPSAATLIYIRQHSISLTRRSSDFYTIQGVGVYTDFSTAASSRMMGTDVTMYASGPMVDIISILYIANCAEWM